jgi:hypothetical protein
MVLFLELDSGTSHLGIQLDVVMLKESIEHGEEEDLEVSCVGADGPDLARTVSIGDFAFGIGILWIEVIDEESEARLVVVVATWV